MKNGMRLGVFGIVIGAAVLASGSFAQRGGPSPDGLVPPTGPVSDTHPSLTSISEQLTQLQFSSNAFPPNLRYHFEAMKDEVVDFVPDTEADFVRLYNVFVEGESINLVVGPNQDSLALFGGDSHNSNGVMVGHNQYNFGGLRVPTPVTFVQQSSRANASHVTLLYWIEE